MFIDYSTYHKNEMEFYLNNFIFVKKIHVSKLHCPSKVKVKPVLLFSSFVHNSSINELKNMKSNEHMLRND